jgi:ribose transport system substrate-binding protein
MLKKFIIFTIFLFFSQTTLVIAEPFYSSPIDWDLNAPELGPNGEEGSSPDGLKLSQAEIDKVKSGNYTAALLWAGAGDWYNAMGRGATARFEELNIKVVATADAQFDPTIQANDVLNALTLNPDIILSLIVDPALGSEYLRPAVEKGVVLSLADNGVIGYQAGKEYVGIVTGDHYQMGTMAAELMVEAVDGKGNIGFIYHDADFFVTNNRDNSFRATLEQRYPEVVIVDAKGFTAEPQTFDIASAMITQNPELDAIYVAWDVAAEGAVEAIRASGRNDIKLVTMDLGANNDTEMARGGIVYATVADMPFDVGYNMATLAAYGLLGKEAQPFTNVGNIKVTKDNLASAWEKSLRQELPDSIKAALGN